MNSPYLKSFTILESLLSLILMGIIITLSYSVFNLVEKQMLQFKNENIDILQYNLFNATIKNDIYNSNSFENYSNELELAYYDNSTINYRITNNFILRQKNEKTDTFKLQIIDYKFLQTNNLKPLNKTLRILIEVLGDTIHTNYYLKTDAAHTINTTYFE